MHLSHCPDLRVGSARDADGAPWFLLGLSVETLEDRLDPLRALAQAPSAEVPRLYGSWAGRWVLIGDEDLHMDACGLLGCFYGHSPDGEVWVSSSPACAAELILPDGKAGADPRTLRYERGLSWFPPPQSRFAGLARLLPSQVLELRNAAVRPRLLITPMDPLPDYEETLDRLRRSLTTALRRLLTVDAGKPWLGLTAGYDSRLMLAIARAADCDVLPFTRLTTRMSVADRVLPPQLARRCGCEHTFFKAPARSFDRSGVVEAHSAGHVSAGDARPLLSGVRDRMSGISLGGHGFALASGFANWRLLPERQPKPNEGAAQIAALFGEPDRRAIEGLRSWLEWVRATPQERIDWRDRMFIEQRQAGWLSAKEQVYDLALLERFPILNAARNHALLLGVAECQRLGSRIQVDLLRRLAPDLLEFPFNPSDRELVWHHPVHACRRFVTRTFRKAPGRLRNAWRRVLRGGSR